MDDDKAARIMGSWHRDNIKKMLRKLYPMKEIEKKDGTKVDIGENSVNWCYNVLTFCKDTQKQRDLLDYIQNTYRFDIYLNEDEIWFNMIMGEMNNASV